jgi:RimJ/RimL family protein N-acetyltransferase
MKRLMLDYAIENLGFRRVEFRVDSMNNRSIDSLYALGAVQEAVLRDHMFRADGSRRDTVLLSIVVQDRKKDTSF